MKRRLPYAGLILALTILYFLTAKLGWSLAFAGSNTHLFWSPAGLAFATVLLLGYQVWPAILLGAVFANLLNPGLTALPKASLVGVSLGIAIGNTVEALIAGWLVNQFAIGRAAFDKSKNFFRFLALAAVLSTMISPIWGVSSLYFAGLQTREIWKSFVAWWMADAASVSLLGSFLILWTKKPLPVLNLHQSIEASALLVALLLTCSIAFAGWLFSAQGAFFVFFTIPILLWSAMRFGRRGGICGCMILAIFAIEGTLHGTGPFVRQNLSTSLFLTQALIFVVTVMTLMLAADVAERKHTESELRSSESRYRELFEGNPQPMMVYHSATLRFLAVNNAAVQHYGYSREEFLQLQFSALAPTEDPATPRTTPSAEKFSLIPVRMRHRKKDGNVVDAEVTGYNLLFDQQPALMVISTDITERLRAEKEVERLTQELERRVRERTSQLEATNKELEAFCYSVSHDLRAPLRSIRGFSEVLLERYSGQLDSRGKEFLHRACESSHVMDQLIEDLLKLSRLTRAEMQRRPVNLTALAQSIASELRLAEPSRDVQFIIAPNLTTHGDEHLLRVALANLLRNAWKFTSKRSHARIEIGVTTDAPPAFFVRDNGAGFDMAYAGKLFGAFQRLHSAKDFAGTGVGLATVQRIINRHGGRAWAAAQVNQGATFYFTIPPDWN
jgi:PAS domain S-box-containing protein